MKTREFYVNFGTGAGNESFENLTDAKQFADKNTAYTQETITIYQLIDGELVPVVARRWQGVEYDPDITDDTADDIIAFGDFGHYEGWCDLEPDGSPSNY